MGDSDVRKDWLAIVGAVLLTSGCTSTGGNMGSGYGVAQQGMPPGMGMPQGQYANHYPKTPAVQPPPATERIAAAVTDNPVTKFFFGEPQPNAMQPNAMQARARQAARPQLDPISLGYEGGPPNAQLFISMAEVNDNGGNVDQARRMYLKALEVEPGNLTALLGLARMEDRLGRLDEAVRVYQGALASHPQDTTALNDLALCYARQGRLQPSLALLERATALQPGKQLYRNNVAKVLVEMNRLDDAITQLAAVYPPAVAHYNLGVMLNQRGRTQEAVHCLSIATQIDPQMQPARTLLAQLSQTPPHLARQPAPTDASTAPGQQTPQAPQTQSPPAANSSADSSTASPVIDNSVLPTPLRSHRP